MTRSPDVYEFSRVVFGVTSSPFLAQFVAQENVRVHIKEFPLAAETVIKSTYMDDSMNSVEDEKKGLDLYEQLKSLWSKVGMHASKCMSNHLEVLDGIPEGDRVNEVMDSRK